MLWPIMSRPNVWPAAASTVKCECGMRRVEINSATSSPRLATEAQTVNSASPRLSFHERPRVERGQPCPRDPLAVIHALADMAVRTPTDLPPCLFPCSRAQIHFLLVPRFGMVDS